MFIQVLIAEAILASLGRYIFLIIENRVEFRKPDNFSNGILINSAIFNLKIWKFSVNLDVFRSQESIFDNRRVTFILDIIKN